MYQPAVVERKAHRMKWAYGDQEMERPQPTCCDNDERTEAGFLDPGHYWNELREMKVFPRLCET